MSNRNEENKINKSLLAELIKVAQADNDVRDIEFQFLLSIASQLGVTVDDFKILFEQYIKFMPPKLEVDRIVQFHRLVLLMNVDLEISHLEINYIKEAGIRMGLNPLAIDQVLNEMNSFPNKIIPPERLLEIFQLYHN